MLNAELSRFSGRGSLENVYNEILRRKESKKDFIVDARSLKLVPGKSPGGGLYLSPLNLDTADWMDASEIRVLPHVTGQIATRVTPMIPGEFFNKMIDQWPEHAAEMATRLMHDTGGRRLVRMMDGNVRAYLSNRYRIIDHDDLLFPALDVAKQAGGHVLEACLSDTHMRLKLTNKAVWDTINVTRQTDGGWYAGGLGDQKMLSRVGAKSWGDMPGGPGTVHPLVTITNSETGHGRWTVRIGILHAFCFNLATVEDIAVKMHLGEAQEVGILSEQTIQMDNETIIAKGCDAIRAAFSEEKFRDIVAMCNKANAVDIVNPVAAVENFVKTTTFPQSKKDELLTHFLGTYNPTAYGLAQAVSRVSQTEDDPDKASEWEDLAGALIRQPETAVTG